MVLNKRIIIWTDRPPFFTKMAFLYLAKKGYKVTFLYKRDDEQVDRQSIHDNKTYGNAEIFNCTNLVSSKQNLENFFKKNEGSIHIVNGFYISKHLSYKEIKKIDPLSKFYLLSEKPKTFKKPRLVFEPLQSLASYKRAIFNKKYIDGVIAFGQDACSYFAKHGWNKNKVHKFIYSFDFNNFKNPCKKKSICRKFLYIGRFDFYYKGVDCLLKSLDYLDREKVDYKCDFVGGYGNDKEQIINFINSHDNCRFLGAINFSDLFDLISEYDCVVVPSVLDGWNVNVLMALCCGTPVITTDGAGSQDLVKRFDYGIIVKKRKYKLFAKAMKQIILSKKNYLYYYRNAAKYSNYFNDELLGQYIENIFSNKKEELY